MRHVVTVAFFAFLCWIIYLADAALPSVFFELVSRLPGGDKLGHFGLFGTLAWLLNRSFGYRTFRVVRLRVPLGAAVVLLFAVLEEISQRWFPNRTFDGFDLVADACGIVAFTALQWRWRATPQDNPGSGG